MERKVVFLARVGSHEYNLQDSNSDEDFKQFILPTFDDLYYGKSYSKQVLGDSVDTDTHDIRKMSELFFKANLNFIEVLFSTSSFVSSEYRVEMAELLQLRDKIARMNLKKLYHSCVGMHKNKMNSLLKGTEKTQHLVDKFGYNTKQALHAFRALSFLQNFAEQNFNDFGKAIRYSDEEREDFLAVKNGEYTLENFTFMVEQILEIIEIEYKEKYMQQEEDLETKNKVDKIIYSIVKKEFEKNDKILQE